MSNLTILALGNSLTAGFMVATRQAYPALLEQKLIVAGYACRIINAGINGETSGGALSRISQALTVEPDIIILETGINDFFLGLDPALTAKNIRRTVQICRQSGVMVILAGMRPIPEISGDEAAFARLYPTIAEGEGVILIPSFLEGVADTPANRSVLTFDGVHPTADGYKVVAETV